MALSKKGSGFGLDLEAKFKNVNVNTDTHTATDTDKHTHTDTDGYADTDKKETKSKRLYLLAKPSVHEKLDKYAKANGDTFNNLVHTLMEEFIERNGL